MICLLPAQKILLRNSSIWFNIIRVDHRICNSAKRVNQEVFSFVLISCAGKQNSMSWTDLWFFDLLKFAFMRYFVRFHEMFCHYLCDTLYLSMRCSVLCDTSKNRRIDSLISGKINLYRWDKMQFSMIC